MHNLKEENSILKAELNKFKEAELDEPFFLEMMTEVFNHMEITLQVIFVYVKPHLKMHYVLSPI